MGTREPLCHGFLGKPEANQQVSLGDDQFAAFFGIAELRENRVSFGDRGGHTVCRMIYVISSFASEVLKWPTRHPLHALSTSR